MAIQEIKEIPASPQRVNQRRIIRDDINYAIEKGVSKFEFIGDDFNYTYLASYANDVADRIMVEKIRHWQREYEKEVLTDDELNIKGFYISRKPYYDIKRKYQPIRISSIKGEDRRRVFCEIDFSDFDRQIKMLSDEQIKDARASHKLINGKWEYIPRRERKC